MALVDKVLSHDRYLAHGVGLLIEEVYQDLSLKNDELLPNVWVLPTNGFQSVYSFIHEKKDQAPCILIGDAKYCHLLHYISDTLEIAFLDINESIRSLQSKLKRIIIAIQQGIAMPCRVKNYLVKMTSLNEKIINLLMLGFSVSGIAHIMKCSINNVSNRKRNIMCKINAKSNQELYVWATMFGYNTLLDSVVMAA